MNFNLANFSNSFAIYQGIFLDRSLAIFTSKSSAILEIWSFHSFLLFTTHIFIRWISQHFRISALLIWSRWVTPIIFHSVCISVNSSVCLVFAVSALVSVSYVINGLMTEMYINHNYFMYCENRFLLLFLRKIIINNQDVLFLKKKIKR